MHIGIIGPCSTGPLADLLPTSSGSDAGWGGYSVVNLVRVLIEKGHRVSVVTLSPELTERRILKGPKLTFYVYPTRTKRRMRDLYKIERQYLKEGILLAKPDLLHAQWTYEFALACLDMNVPTLVTCRDNAFRVLRFNRDLYRLGRLYLQLRVIRRARFLTAVSPYIANALGWLARTEIEVIPNPVEIPHEGRNLCDGDLQNCVRIATVINGWQNLKNPKAAIKAFSLLRRHVPDAGMFMYGKGFQQGGPASQWAVRNDLCENIHFCGFLPHHDLLEKLKEMSILLHPSLEESFGMAIIEAMALNLPVIAGNGSGGVNWVLDEGRAGFLTDVTKPEEITQTLLTCIRQREDRERKQKNAHERVLTLFSPDSVAEQYTKMYEKVLSSY